MWKKTLALMFNESSKPRRLLLRCNLKKKKKLQMSLTLMILAEKNVVLPKYGLSLESILNNESYSHGLIG